VRLFEHPDFEDAIKAAENYFAHQGLTAQFIEKDYYVTEALRIVALQYPTQVIFKGGTSLSKGWKLIERFSEDIDLFLNRDAFNPHLSNNGIDRTFKTIQDYLLNGDLKLQILTGLGSSSKGISRNSYFSYTQRFSGNQAIANRVLLEMGIRSGTYPTENILLSSYLGQFLQETRQGLEAEDEKPFSMQLLHFRRTFVEKLFAIHSKVIAYEIKSEPIGNYARHYYDLFYLAQKPEVKLMLENGEYQNIKDNCHQISLSHFGDNYYKPENLTFSKSKAFFPTQELRKTIINEYEKQCRNLCYAEYPKWQEIESCFNELRNLL
jgi:predicted nucleotidyltransferase component of viral defense system